MSRTVLDEWNKYHTPWEERREKIRNAIAREKSRKKDARKQKLKDGTDLEERLWGKRPVKSYAEYMAESKPIKKHLAPSLARPKFSTGDTPKSRRYREYMIDKGLMLKHEVPIFKNGIINVTEFKRKKHGQA